MRKKLVRLLRVLLYTSGFLLVANVLFSYHWIPLHFQQVRNTSLHLDYISFGPRLQLQPNTTCQHEDVQYKHTTIAPNTNKTANPNIPNTTNAAIVDRAYYLLPINFILSKRYPNSSDSRGRDIIQNAIKFGHGLKRRSVRTSSNVVETGWEENGVLYKLYRNPINSTTETAHPPKIVGKYQVKSPYTPLYEEYVPFDKQAFFWRQEDKDGDGQIPISEDLLEDKAKKIILWYTKTRYSPPLPELTPLQVCPDYPCVMTTNRSYANDSSAMLFAAQILEEEPPPRTPEQVFIFHNHETPYSLRFEHLHKGRWKNAFNWTMTFRMDSDIPAFYGTVRKLPENLVPTKDYRAIVSRKTKLVAWMASHCNTLSKRDQYVKELQKYIPVSVYGKCGVKRCGSRERDDKCSDLFSTNYKFYLSFENALCTDYITEKLFKYMSLDLITVGRASNDFYRHIPEDIFINVADYPSPKDLAERLKFLDNNDEAYIEMLRAKDNYASIFQDYQIRRPDGGIKYMTYHHEETSFCHICYRLWNVHLYTQVIPDVFKWFRRSKCQRNVEI